MNNETIMNDGMNEATEIIVETTDNAKSCLLGQVTSIALLAFGTYGAINAGYKLYKVIKKGVKKVSTSNPLKKFKKTDKDEPVEIIEADCEG